MSLNRLDAAADLTDDAGRGQLQETLELIANRLRLQTKELELVKSSDKIVAPVAIEEFPLAAGTINTGAEGGSIGDITMRSSSSTPSGTLPCDGLAVSRIDFADLFALIGEDFGAGDGVTTFNVPDLRDRAPVGSGNLYALAQQFGVSAVQLTRLEIPSHQHNMNHSHNYRYSTGPGTVGYRSIGTDVIGPSPTGTGSLSDISSPILDVADSVGGGTLTADGEGLSGSSTGNGHTNLQPSLGVAFYIRFRVGPSDVVQTLPLQWGKISAQWRLDSSNNFPTSTVTNEVLVPEDHPEGVTRVTATSGTLSGSTSDLKLIGLVRIPYNFGGWRTKALRIRTKVSSTGVSGGATATVTLKISDPVSSGSYLATTYTRVLTESGGNLADSGFVDAIITAEDLGKDWKPGYLFRFELEFTHPKTFTTADLSVGLLQLNWS